MRWRVGVAPARERQRIDHAIKALDRQDRLDSGMVGDRGQGDADAGVGEEPRRAARAAILRRVACGRAPFRESMCEEVQITGGNVSSTKKQKRNINNTTN